MWCGQIESRDTSDDFGSIATTLYLNPRYLGVRGVQTSRILAPWTDQKLGIVSRTARKMRGLVLIFLWRSNSLVNLF